MSTTRTTYAPGDSASSRRPRPNLRAARHEAGLSSTEVAARARISASHLRSLESGDRRGLPVIRGAVTHVLSEALGRALDEGTLFEQQAA